MKRLLRPLAALTPQGYLLPLRGLVRFAHWRALLAGALISLPDATEAARWRGLTPVQSHLIKRYIEEAAAKERLEPALIRSVIAVESAFNYKAVSRVGAKGLMQIMPQTAQELGEQRALDHTNPRANVLAGSRLLRKLVNRYQGNLKIAIAAYNAGPGAVSRYKGIPPYPETRDYVKKVLARLKFERARAFEISDEAVTRASSSSR